MLRIYLGPEIQSWMWTHPLFAAASRVVQETSLGVLGVTERTRLCVFSSSSLPREFSLQPDRQNPAWVFWLREMVGRRVTPSSWSGR